MARPPNVPTKSKSATAEQRAENPTGTGPRTLEVPPTNCPKIFRGVPSRWSQNPGPVAAQPLGPAGPASRPEQEPASERRPDSINPDPGNTVPAHGRRPPSCCCGFARTADEPGNPRPACAAARWPRRTRRPSPRCCSTPSISRARASSRTAPATSEPGSRMGTTSCPRSLTGSRTARRELEAQLRQACRSASSNPARSAEQAAEEAAVAYMIEQLSPDQLEHLVRAGHPPAPRAARPPQPHALQPLRAQQGLRAGLRLPQSLVIGGSARNPIGREPRALLPPGQLQEDDVMLPSPTTRQNGRCQNGSNQRALDRTFSHSHKIVRGRFLPLFGPPGDRNPAYGMACASRAGRGPGRAAGLRSRARRTCWGR